MLVALVIPLVDIISVWRGPTHTITQHHFEVYTAVAIAFLVPGGGAAYLGPPDVLFYALFLARGGALGPPRRLDVVRDDVHVRDDRRSSRRRRDVDGLPALPFLSFGFLVANGDLLWRGYAPVGGFVGLVAGFFLGRGPAPC